MTLFQTPTTTVEKPTFTLRNYQAEAVEKAMAVDNGVVDKALPCSPSPIISARPTASLALYYQIIGRCVRPSPGKRQPVVFDLVDNFSKFGDPMSYRIVSSRPGLHAVLCDKGRLTNRIIEDGDERDAPVMFGQHHGRRLRDVPDDYIAWFLTNEAKGRNWHTMKFEQMRRAIFGRGVTRCR